MNHMNVPQTDSAGFNRRDFLKGGSFATLMTMLGGVPLFAQATGEEEKKPVGPKVKVGVIGLGVWGREILDQLGRLEQAEIVAICDNYPAMVRRSSSKAPGAAQAEDAQAVIDNKDVQAVIIATPSHQHKDLAIAALKAGKHVYCEAPLATSLEDARAIALAAKNNPEVVFQPGLQMRSDPQRLFLLPFIRSGALGKFIMARAQWHKKQSWRSTSPSAEREKALNWRLSQATSIGLAGEIGIHQLDQAGWFINADAAAVTGFGSINFWNDGRDVADTLHLVIEYPNDVRMAYSSTLANSFDSEYEILYGSDAAVMMRDNKAWMFKEVDSPLLGWEVYARKDSFYKETGIALIAGGSKQDALDDKATDKSAFPFPTLYYALQSFLGNCAEVAEMVQDIKDTFGSVDKATLAQQLSEVKFRPAANYQDGYNATVLAIKANEAITKRQRIELKKEWFELA